MLDTDNEAPAKRGTCRRRECWVRYDRHQFENVGSGDFGSIVDGYCEVKREITYRPEFLRAAPSSPLPQPFSLPDIPHCLVPTPMPHMPVVLHSCPIANIPLLHHIIPSSVQDWYRIFILLLHTFSPLLTSSVARFSQKPDNFSRHFPNLYRPFAVSYPLFHKCAPLPWPSIQSPGIPASVPAFAFHPQFKTPACSTSNSNHAFVYAFLTDDDDYDTVVISCFSALQMFICLLLCVSTLVPFTFFRHPVSVSYARVYCNRRCTSVIILFRR